MQIRCQNFKQNFSLNNWNFFQIDRSFKSWQKKWSRKNRKSFSISSQVSICSLHIKVFTWRFQVVVSFIFSARNSFKICFWMKHKFYTEKVNSRESKIHFILSFGSHCWHQSICKLWFRFMFSTRSWCFSQEFEGFQEFFAQNFRFVLIRNFHRKPQFGATCNLVHQFNETLILFNDCLSNGLMYANGNLFILFLSNADAHWCNTCVE